MSGEFEEGHDFVYRVTATGDDGKPQTCYYIRPHKAAFWRDQLRRTGYASTVARVPATDFTELTDAELDALAQQERNET